MKRKFYNYFSTSILRALSLGLCSLMFAVTLQAQPAGDYRSAATGNWSAGATWQVRDGGGSWSSASSAPTATNNVYIQNGHTVTADVEGSCSDLHINTLGVLAITGATNVNVNGKIRCFTGAAEASGSDGVYIGTSSTATASSMITTPSTGVLKFVGGTRNITNTGEWNSSGTSNAAEFALTSGATGTLVVGVKFKPLTFSSGIVSSAAFISISTGDAIIKNGARLISSRSGLTSEVFGNSSSAAAGTVTIESGGVLELTGSTPTISANSFVNNGTVVYSRAGTQTWLQLGTTTAPGTAVFNTYNTVILTGTSNKTLSTPSTISTLLQFTGTAAVVPTATNTLTMANGSTIEKGSTTNPTTIISTGNSAFLNLGTDPSHLINLLISASNTNSGELASAPVMGKIGTLTVNSGVTYGISGSRTVTNVVNNGIVTLNPGSSMTLTINNSYSGSGTVTSNLSTGNAVNGIPEYYSGGITIGSTAATTLNMTSGSSQELRNLTITGPTTLASPLKINNALTLTATTLTTNGNALTFTNTGRLIGAGTINGDLTLPTGVAGTVGTSISPGNAGAGTLNINGTLSSAADFVVGIGGTNAGTDYDQLLVSGAVSLSGDSLRVTLLNAFDPPADATFVILDGASLTGTFTVTDLPTLLNGKTWSVLYDNAAGTVTLKVNGIIPIELSQFNAKRNQTATLLFWRTESERDNALFHIEQSTNGTDFQTIGQVKGNGTTSAVHIYDFTHSTPSVGVNYYRLKQEDFNGKTSYSSVRSVLFGKNGLVVKTTLVQETLDIVTADETSVPLSIFNVSGQQVLNLKAQGAQSINISTLPAGTYIVQTQTGEVARFVKQ
jgi:hypothetical protein